MESKRIRYAVSISIDVLEVDDEEVLLSVVTRAKRGPITIGQFETEGEASIYLLEILESNP